MGCPINGLIQDCLRESLGGGGGSGYGGVGGLNSLRLCKAIH